MTGMIMIDLQKAAVHDILLKKLYTGGFSKHSATSFQFFLTIRSSLVNDHISRGSIFGSFYFFIYINGMPKAAKCNLFLCADYSV